MKDVPDLLGERVRREVAVLMLMCLDHLVEPAESRDSWCPYMITSLN